MLNVWQRVPAGIKAGIINITTINSIPTSTPTTVIVLVLDKVTEENNDKINNRCY